MGQGSGGATNEAGRVAAAAVRHLRRADPALADVIRRVGPCRLQLHSGGTHFETLARSMVYQQLSGKAAATIHGRVREALGEVTPAAVMATTDDVLRAAGLSRQKIGYLRDLARRTESGELAVERLHELNDDDLMEAVCSVKGIGRWTAQMFLMFRLGRPDVLPELDLGVRKAVQQVYRLRKLPDSKRLTRIGARWAPYRTYASWYLWRSLEL